MRPVLHGDVVAAARVLRALPAAAREVEMAALIEAAQAGDRYRKRFGRAHLRHGNGSLMAAAGLRPRVPEPGFDDCEYLDCLAIVIAALVERCTGSATRPSRTISRLHP